MTEDPKPTPQVIDARWLEPARLRRVTILASILFLGALLFAVLHPDSMAQHQEVFGDLSTSLGIPLWSVVTGIVLVAYLPFPFAFYHLFRILFRGASEGRLSTSKLGIVGSIFSVPRHHPDLKISRLIVISIFGSYIVAMFTYAYISDKRDLEKRRNERSTTSNPLK